MAMKLFPQRLLPETPVLIEDVIRVAATLIMAFLFQRLAFLVIGRLERFLARRGQGTHQSIQRARTLSQILRSAVTVLVAAGALIHSLGILGWDVRPLLAGAGVLGVAIGFGAQSLVRDLISGLFVLAENQYSVGDLVEINGQPATVEELTVRCTVLRDFNGFVHYVPNGEMRIVTNRSRGWNRLTVDVTVRAGLDVDRALEVCRGEVASFNTDPAWRQRLLEPAQVWGVESVAGAEATIRTALRVEPGKAGQEAARELRRRLYRALSETGIATKAGGEPAAPSPETPTPGSPSAMAPAPAPLTELGGPPVAGAQSAPRA